MISVTILTKNCPEYLDEVLNALRDFDEVLILDNGSTDNTLELAAAHPNVTIHHSPFIGFGPLHNKAVELAKHDWILSLDADEVASPDMVKQIHELSLDPRSVYRFARHNYYKGQWIKGCGWYPDRQLRLFNRKHTQFTNAQVHESVITTGLKVQTLPGHIKHYSYATVSDFLRKMQHYSDLFAHERHGTRSSMSKAILHGLFTFFKSYILKRGILDGAAGFEISLYNANTAFYKYLKLAEKSQD